MARQFKLPKPVPTATDKELADYASQWDPSGDRRLLAEEVLRLRKTADKAHTCTCGSAPEAEDIRQPKPVKEEKAAKKQEEDEL